MIKRRSFLVKGSLASALFLGGFPGCIPIQKRPVFMIVSGWQNVNIGDIAHTPGLVSLLYKYFPEARIILWPKDINTTVEQMLLKHFPGLEIIRFDPERTDSDKSKIDNLIHQSDMLIHSSGPGVIGKDQLTYWKETTTKPYGILGVTISGVWDELKILLDNASFLYTRETESIKKLENNNITTPIIGFAPDSTFSTTISNDDLAEGFLSRNNLRKKEYICIVPRLRYTPYHKIHPDINWTDEKIKEVTGINDRYKEEDHAKAREVIEWWVRHTGQKVILCPEMTYQTEIMDPLLIDPLSGEIASNVVKHDYWLPDEAASLYKNARAIISMECHSPIIAASVGTPCFYLRQPEDTIKGQMWYDIGLDNWVFEIEEVDAGKIIAELKNVIENPSYAESYLTKAMEKVNRLYDIAFSNVKTLLKKN